MIRNITAVGDCNTLGAGENEKKGYPEKVGDILGLPVNNVGYTMSTTREGIYLLKENIKGSDCILIQFGLVDSYKTFKYSPYVPYYPDNPLRRFCRSITKKYKKVCRNLGLNKSIGEVNVVPIEEYESNIRFMMELCGSKRVVLIDTVPHKENWRNPEIKNYNNVLDRVAADYPNCTRVLLYEKFEQNFDNFYMDSTHCNVRGYRFIADKVIEQLKNSSA